MVGKEIKKNLIERSVLNDFRRSYSLFINHRRNNHKYIDLMKLISFELTIIILEIFLLQKKELNKKEIYLPRIKILKRLPKNTGNFVYQILRFLKSIFNSRNYYCPKMLINFNNPITFTLTELLLSYHQEKKQKFSISNTNEWFKRKKINIEKVDKEITEIILPFFKNSLKKNKIKNINNFLSIFHKNTCFLVSWFRIYKNYLEKQKIPKKFWSGTMGNPFNRLFAYCVKNKKGKVTVFEHGTGTGYFKTDMECSTLELDWADHFITFGPSMVEGTKKNAKINLKYRVNKNKKTKISWIPTSLINKNRRKKDHSKFDYVYVAAWYTENMANIDNFYPDNFMISFQRKILKYLKKKKLNFAFKPHPVTPTYIINKIIKGLNIKVLKNNFDNIAWNNEILIFDCPQTSVFKEALRLKLPIIIFDFPRFKFYKSAHKLVKKRCKIVKTDLTSNGNVIFKKSDLDKSLIDSKKLINDNSFLNEYFPLKN